VLYGHRPAGSTVGLETRGNQFLNQASPTPTPTSRAFPAGRELS
jgi:hypothetical protein